MTQIKETIELLTKILRHNGTSKIKPEAFRQAKFDKNEAACPMWKLLFEVIYYLKHRKIDDIAIKAYSELSSDELCVYVKTEMKMRGFVSRSFHELPNDMSHGSRELLLAFGWLMCRSGLIELFMEQCCTFLDGMEVVGDLDKLSLPRKKIGQHSANLGTGCSGEVRDKISYLMWLNGKLRMSLRNVHILQQQKTNLTNKVHEMTEGTSVDPSQRNHLTVLELMMLRNPELLKRNLQLLESDNQRLECMICWQTHDDLFWKWMESVLDAKIVDSGFIEEVDDKITPRTQATKLKLDSKLELVETVKKYEAIVSDMESRVISQEAEKPLTMADIDKALIDIKSEIATHVDLLLQKLPADYSGANSSASSVSVHSTAVNNQYQGELHSWKPVRELRRLRREESQASSLTSASGADREVSAMESELQNLQDLMERLQEDIEYKQQRYREDLSSVTSGMESLYEYISSEPVVIRQ